MSSNAGLLVIDMQVGNFKESAPVYGGRDLLSRIRSLIARPRADGVPVIHVQHCGSEIQLTSLTRRDGRSTPPLRPSRAT